MIEKNRFSKAIVRIPCRRMVEGITTADLGKPDYGLAVEQHQNYIAALRNCGLDVTILPADERYPDSVFVEDTALLTPACAIITNPGADSRKGEIAAIHPVVARFYEKIETISTPGTVDGGDIMMVGSHYYIGLSKRTNQRGAAQLIAILHKYNLDGTMIKLEKVLHLKTAVAYLENNIMLSTAAFLTAKDFKNFDMIGVDPYESYAANSVWINGRVIMPAGNPKTRDLVEKAGYEVIAVDTSEFRKLDGGVSCLSLRF
jgi:dimethylargininase